MYGPPVLRRACTSRLALATAFALALACESRTHDVHRPSPTAPGTPTGEPAGATLGQSGGTLASPDGRLTITVPEGALAGPLAVSIQPITNLAPGGLGGAWRLAPAGAAFATPLLLTFHAGSGGPLRDLAIAVQDQEGYWVHAAGVARDPLAGTLTVAAAHFSDWSLVAAPSALDLHGTFAIDTTMGMPVTVSGSATLTFAGSDATTAVYLLSGTAEVPATIADGATACSPAPPYAPVQALRPNVAEVPAAEGTLWWGTSALWSLACADSTSRLVDLVFDTYGINHLGCARTPGPEVVGPDRLEGTYAIDCGGGEGLVGTWSFSGERCGTECTPSSPVCHAGLLDCTSGTAVCADTGALAPPGTACGTDQVCAADGTCIACVDGWSCPPSGACREIGTLSCSGGPVCADGPPLAPGTPCGTGLVCDPEGACSPCVELQPCVPADVCDLGETSCSTGVQTCIDTGVPDAAADGSPCTRVDGSAGTCSGGSCE